MSEETKKKWREARIKTLGSEEAYNEYYRRQGEKFGKLKIPTKGFGSRRDTASEMGRRGGLKSKGKKK